MKIFLVIVLVIVTIISLAPRSQLMKVPSKQVWLESISEPV